MAVIEGGRPAAPAVAPATADAAASIMGSPAAAPAPAQGGAPLLSTGMGQRGPTLIDEEGQEVILKGLSVFGFNSM
jgi:sugar (pentulose or hexulose) kinase